MLTALDAIVDRLVQQYDPERIILFGSRAAGSAGVDSDIDLLIVKDTPQRPIDRRVEVERLLADRSVGIDVVVYTPRELCELYWAGSPFVEDVVERGRVLYMRKVTGAWLREASEDLESARILLDHGKYRAACLHSQQAAEKALKALVLERGRRPPRTHDLIELLNAARADGWAVTWSTDEAAFLTGVYRARYPTEEGLLPHGDPILEDARRAVDAARDLLEWVRGAVSP